MRILRFKRVSVNGITHNHLAVLHFPPMSTLLAVHVSGRLAVPGEVIIVLVLVGLALLSWWLRWWWVITAIYLVGAYVGALGWALRVLPWPTVERWLRYGFRGGMVLGLVVAGRAWWEGRRLFVGLWLLGQACLFGLVWYAGRL